MTVDECQYCGDVHDQTEHEILTLLECHTRHDYEMAHAMVDEANAHGVLGDADTDKYHREIESHLVPVSESSGPMGRDYRRPEDGPEIIADIMREIEDILNDGRYGLHTGFDGYAGTFFIVRSVEGDG